VEVKARRSKQLLESKQGGRSRKNHELLGFASHSNWKEKSPKDNGKKVKGVRKRKLRGVKGEEKGGIQTKRNLLYKTEDEKRPA